MSRPRFDVKLAGRAALVIAIPAIVNAAVWYGIVGPVRDRAQRADEARRVGELAPKLAAALNDSRPLVAEWRRAGLPSGADASGAVITIRRLADKDRVQLGKLGAQGQNRAIEVDATGSFNKLARWLGDVEHQSGLRIDEWTFATTDVGEPHKLSVKLTASDT